MREDIGAAKDFNKSLRLHYRQRLSVDELFCMIQHDAGHGYLFFYVIFVITYKTRINKNDVNRRI